MCARLWSSWTGDGTWAVGGGQGGSGELWGRHARVQGAGAGGGAEGQQVMGWFNLEQCATSQPLHHLTVVGERCSSQKCCSHRVTIWRRMGLAGAADNVCIFIYTPPPPPPQ